MAKISAKEYARLKGVSLYQVIKMIQRGELQGTVAEENGVRTRYVVLDEEDARPQEAPRSRRKLEAPSPTPASSLQARLEALEKRVAELEAALARCCPKVSEQ
ncbi:hypothetical protein [Hydrogenimonas sp.]